MKNSLNLITEAELMEMTIKGEIWIIRFTSETENEISSFSLLVSSKIMHLIALNVLHFSMTIQIRIFQSIFRSKMKGG